MTNKLTLSTLLLGVALSLGVTTNSALAQAQPQGKTETATPQKSRGEAGAPDENIKKDRTPSDPAVKPDAPPEKGGPKTRGSGCPFTIDNWVPWPVSIYVDGTYVGEVAKFGKLNGWAQCGTTVFYGKVTFTDGTFYSWGPRSIEVTDSFTWKLNL